MPVVTLLVLFASGKVKAHLAAIVALIVANIITIAIFAMPAGMSIRASLLGVVIGFFPIGWIVLNMIFLCRITDAQSIVVASTATNWRRGTFLSEGVCESTGSPSVFDSDRLRVECANLSRLSAWQRLDDAIRW